jgi:hypothetical protein
MSSCLLGRYSTIWVTPPALFCVECFQGRVSQFIYPSWPRTVILLISASWVARIISMSLLAPGRERILKQQKSPVQEILCMVNSCWFPISHQRQRDNRSKGTKEKPLPAQNFIFSKKWRRNSQDIPRQKSWLCEFILLRVLRPIDSCLSSNLGSYWPLFLQIIFLTLFLSLVFLLLQFCYVGILDGVP